MASIGEKSKKNFKTNVKLDISSWNRDFEFKHVVFKVQCFQNGILVKEVDIEGKL